MAPRASIPYSHPLPFFAATSFYSAIFSLPQMCVCADEPKTAKSDQNCRLSSPVALTALFSRRYSKAHA